MGLIKNKLSCILKSLNVHKCWRIDHANFAIIPCQFAAPLNEARVKVAVKLQWLFIVIEVSHPLMRCKIMQN